MQIKIAIWNYLDASHFFYHLSDRVFHTTVRHECADEASLTELLTPSLSALRWVVPTILGSRPHGRHAHGNCTHGGSWNQMGISLWKHQGAGMSGRI